MMPQLVMLSMADNKMLKESIKKGFSVMSVASIPAVLEDLKLNIIPEDIKMRKALKGRAHEMAKIAAFAMISLIVFCSILLMHVVFNRLYLERLRSKYTSQVQEAEKLKQIAQKNYTVESFLNKKGQSLGILTELYNALPPAIYLNSMNLKEDRTMSFTGTADTMSSVFSLVTSLENNPYFSGVKVESTRSRRVENKEVADFSLTLTLEKDV
jgi:Tfp pilus assembly protein PilN